MMMKILRSLLDNTCLMKAQPDPMSASTVKSSAPFSLTHTPTGGGRRREGKDKRKKGSEYISKMQREMIRKIKEEYRID